MKINKIAKIAGGQDGAIYGTELFRFSSKGECKVYDLADLNYGKEEALEPLAVFSLDCADKIVPHSNAVCFGHEFYEEGDEYPLLYTNIYNNYAKADDKMLGTCLVYRIQRTENEFRSTLLQQIKIGFTEDSRLWKVDSNNHGARPYGNFLVDRDTGSLWAFVMRNEDLGTRYFRFDLSSVRDGEADPRFNIKSIVLGEEHIREYFDLDYCRYLQGAVLHKGKIYSTEGFSNDVINRPAIRVIDLADRQEKYYDIMDMGFVNEAEFISFYNDTCFYSDIYGSLYTVEF